MNKEENNYGQIIDVIIISSAVAEGITFKSV